MNLVFFGDSVTSGENNNFKSYVNYIKSNHVIQSFGVSGTTFGEYSPYPVDGNSFISVLMKNDKDDLINCADAIFIEYGFNDATAVCMKLCPLEVVITNMIKCIDFIHQKNSQCRTVFLYGQGDFIDKVANNQIDYLKTDYLKNVYDQFFDFSSSGWAYTYSNICKAGRLIFDDIVDIFPPDLNFDKDNLHPDDTGYQKIGRILTKYVTDKFYMI